MNDFRSLKSFVKLVRRIPIIGTALHHLRNWGRMFLFWWQYSTHSAALKDKRFDECCWKDRIPCLTDATTLTGFDAHYLYHTAWACRVLKKISPERHVDISSCLRFVTMASAFIPTDFFDYRPAEFNLEGLTSKHADLTMLPFESNSIFSMSCMHVIEHVGLGRYGDPIDPCGDIKAMSELGRVIARGGHLLIVVPVGRSRIAFNAHRIYNPQQILDTFPDFHLRNFALIDDSGKFYSEYSPVSVPPLKYGCGCFWLKKN